ncbi:MAG: hypothetical protein V1826_00925 [bacterium]
MDTGIQLTTPDKRAIVERIIDEIDQLRLDQRITGAVRQTFAEHHIGELSESVVAGGIKFVELRNEVMRLGVGQQFLRARFNDVAQFRAAGVHPPIRFAKHSAPDNIT